MNYWLMKSEPTCFSIHDLAKRPQQCEPWDGVRNYQARNFLKAMEKGDLAFFYHSSCPKPGIVGMIKIVHTAYPDKTGSLLTRQNNTKNTYATPRWYTVDVQLIRIFKSIIALEHLRKDPKLKTMRLLQKGNRLSVMPLTMFEWQHIMTLIPNH